MHIKTRSKVSFATYIIHKLNFGMSKMIMKILMEYVKNRMFLGDNGEQL